jgi:hypothetical protein
LGWCNVLSKRIVVGSDVLEPKWIRSNTGVLH